MLKVLARNVHGVLLGLFLFTLTILVYKVNNVYLQTKPMDARLTESTVAPARVSESHQGIQRVSSSKAYLIPSDDILRGLSESQLQQIYWKYINTIQVLCRNQTRIGPLKDGGKEVCIDEAYIPRTPCLVYSFGSRNDFEFEKAVKAHFDCQIHTFDPSMHAEGKQVKPPEAVTFHDIGLGATGMTDSRGWSMQTLSSLIKDLHHTNSTLDILKIDIEGGEWFALPQIFASGVLRRVKQICIEIHFGAKRTNPAVRETTQLSILRQLHEHGFLVFMHERNLYSLSGEMTTVNEISLINNYYYDTK